MDEFKEESQQQKRQERAKDVKIVFPIKDNYQVFNVVDEKGFLKYTGFVKGSTPSEEDNCSCKSFENGNNTKAEGSYIATHGHAFQDKHILAAREAAVQQKMEVVST